jgi:hypothetical protein
LDAIAESLAIGNRTGDVAKRFKVSAGRVGPPTMRTLIVLLLTLLIVLPSPEVLPPRVDHQRSKTWEAAA